MDSVWPTPQMYKMFCTESERNKLFMSREQWRRQRFFAAGAMGVLGVLPRVL